MGVPSVIVGLFVYGVLVATMGHFSRFAGSVALAILMFPVVVRTTEDQFATVPDTLRESGLALGATRARVMRKRKRPTPQVPAPALARVAETVRFGL